MAANVQVVALLIETGGKIISQVIESEQTKNRLKLLAIQQAQAPALPEMPETPPPVIKIITSQPELLEKSLEAIPSLPSPDLKSEEEREKNVKPVTEHKAKSIASGCIPCSLGHFSTCSGLLNEAMRFALKEGMSGEVNDRVNMCVDELNALERVDLRPEMTTNLTGWEKDLAVKTLNTSRSIRHSLEGLDSVEALEKAAADTQANRKEIGREWFQHKTAVLPPDLQKKAMEELAKVEDAKEH